MKLTELIQFDLIQFNFSASDKKDALNKLTGMLVEKGIIENRDEFLQALFDREAMSTTGVGDGIAIPHAKASCFKKAMIIYAKSNDQANILINNRETCNLIKKKGFVIVKTQN